MSLPDRLEFSHLHFLCRSSLIGFAINSGDEESSPGMLLSLLQLCLATLMALFRDDEISMLVSAAELGLLIRETGTALLDARLSASDELNNGARSQMIRAINKVRIKTGFIVFQRFCSPINTEIHSLRFKRRRHRLDTRRSKLF